MNWEVAKIAFPFLLKAARYTIIFSFVSECFGIALGLALALLRLSRLKVLRFPALAYIDIFRGTPLLVQLMFIYYALPLLGPKLNAFMSGLLGLSLNSGAYVAEIFRAGIQSIHKGQMEAARSLGMTYLQAMRFVIIPQAWRLVIPPLTNEFIALIKDSSLLSVITVSELLYVTRNVSTWRANATPYIIAALLYLAMTLPLTRVVAWMERRFRYVH